MLNKRKIPKDWTKLSTGEMQEIVRYLQRHHREYKLTRIDNKTIKIGSVPVFKDTVWTKHGNIPFFTICGITICAGAQPQLYRDINTLYNNCEQRITPLQEKIKDRAKSWWSDNRDVTIVTSCAVAIVAAFVLMFAYAKNKTENEQEKVRQEQENAIQELQDRIKRSLSPTDLNQIKGKKTFCIENLFKQHIR